MRKAYQTDLSDAEWSCLESHLPAPKATGRPRMHTTREILNAIFYVVRGGCAWRLLPHDFPPWKTVYHYFRFWRLDGTWERMHSALRKRVRVRLKRNPQPSALGSGQPVDQDDWSGRKRTRLRRRQEGEGQEATFTGGHAGIGARSEGPQRQPHRPRRHQAPTPTILA
jgi:putative transposase